MHGLLLAVLGAVALDAVGGELLQALGAATNAETRAGAHDPILADWREHT